MNKNIFIIESPNDINPYKNSVNFDNVHITNLDSLINAFHGVICIACIENIPSPEQTGLVHRLVSKLRPGGELIISLKNRKELCRLYLDNVITDDIFHNHISEQKYPMSANHIATIVQELHNIVVTKIIYSELKTYVHIIKTKI